MYGCGGCISTDIIISVGAAIIQLHGWCYSAEVELFTVWLYLAATGAIAP